MLKFQVCGLESGEAPFVLRNAHLVGADYIGVRSNIQYEDGAINCQKRTTGPAALALQVEVPEVGEMTLQTCLLPDRVEPYILTLELARHRLMLLLSKQEDWMMFDLPLDHPAMKRAATAKSLFVEALNRINEPEEAHRLSMDCLAAAIDASEELALAHAELLYRRRLEAGQFHRGVFGCGVGLAQATDPIRSSLQSNFDYMVLPLPWCQLQPTEDSYDWTAADSWAEWAFRNRMPILAGPVLSFDRGVAPDWLAVVEHDYETMRDVLYEHVEKVVTRYRNVVTLWNVVSGLHANAGFDFTLDQLMDLTRMAVLLIKKVQPSAKTLVEVTQPFGEYYACNARSIPPMIYADMVLQAGIPVDAFGVRLLMGRPTDGQYTRDLMQVSAMLDRFNGLGKPVHVTAAAVPSEPIGFEPEPMVNGPEGNAKGTPVHPPDGNSGYWRKPWSPLVQSHWLEAFYHIALSKPYIDSVAWLDLADHDQTLLDHGGLAMADFKAKGAFQRVTSLRKALHADSAAARNSPTSA